MERRLSASEGGKVFQFLFFDPSGVLYGVTEGKLYKGYPPSHYSFNWIASATLVGGGGWNVFKFLFFDPQGVLYGVQNDRLSRRYPHTDPPVTWIDNSQLIGTGAWGGFQHLFFMADGQLYGVHNDRLYRGPPPSLPYKTWLKANNKINRSCRSVFKFLMAPLKWRTVFMVSKKSAVVETLLSHKTEDHPWLLTTVGIKISVAYLIKCKVW